MKKAMNITDEKSKPGGKYVHLDPASYLKDEALERGLWPELFSAESQLLVEETEFSTEDVERRLHLKSSDPLRKLLDLLGQPTKRDSHPDLGIETYHYSQEVIVVLKEDIIKNLVLGEEGKPWLYVFVRSAVI